jgi:hypothetical protein
MQTAGKTKFAARMADHVGEQIDAACPITRPGGTARQMGGALGGVAGAAISSAGRGGRGDVQIGQFAWLGLGTFHFVVTKSSMMGKPTGEPLARVSYADVARAKLTEGKLTLRIDLELFDGRSLAFEAKRLGQNKPNVDVLGLLHSRVEKSI